MPRSKTSRAAIALTVVLLAVACAAAAARSSGGPVGIGGAAVLYRDDFRQGQGMPAGWEVEGGRWQGVVGGAGVAALAHADGPGSGGTVVAGSATWTDYVVEADVKPAPGAGGVAGVVGRYQSQEAYYECAIQTGMGVQLWRIGRGGAIELGGRRTAVDASRFHRLTLTMRGTRIACAMDGRPAASVVDPTLGEGRIGLAAGDGDAAEFAKVVVTSTG